jgi:teichuronic acid biosynthesis glycosyltransferase TuaG
MKFKSYLVSVIIPTYNSAKFLKRAIKSVLQQTYSKLELIIVDDCSTDNSYEVIKYFIKIDKRIRYFKTTKNSGVVAVPRNVGLSKAKGKYVAFLDADDYWNLDKLNYQISRIENCKLSFTAANYQHENLLKKSNFLINYLRIFLQIFFMKRIAKEGYFWLYIYNPFLVSSAIISKDLLKKYKFNSDVNIREDLTFWLEILKKHNKNFKYHSKILITITRAKFSLSSDRIKEFNRIINSLSNSFFKTKEYNKFNYFLLGIGLRALKIFLSSLYKVFRTKILIIFYFISMFYFLVFYSPLFWKLGENLIFYNTQKKTDVVFVLSGHQGFDYWNQSYVDRYFDIIDYLEKYDSKKDTKFFLLGKLQSIPEQKILESLIIDQGVEKQNINVIYKEYASSENALKLLITELNKNNNISSITIITSPYHSYRLSQIWKNISNENYDTIFFKNKNLPKKNSFFERSMNKKEIIYELLANGYYISQKKFIHLSSLIRTLY